MKEFLIKILVILLFSTSCLNAIEENQIKEVMSEKISKIVNIISNKNLSKDDAAKRTFKILDEVFDYQTMAKISLGKKYKKLTKDEKNDFIKAFEYKLKNSYLDKLDLYTNEKILVTEIKKIKKNRIKLYSEIYGKTETYKIIYKFHKNKKDQWLIYDVNIIGISIMKTYKKQFSSFLRENSIKQLIESF